MAPGTCGPLLQIARSSFCGLVPSAPSLARNLGFGAANRSLDNPSWRSEPSTDLMLFRFRAGQKSAEIGSDLGVSVDINSTFEVRAVFYHQFRRCHVARDRSMLLDFNSVTRAQITLDCTVNQHFTGNCLGVDIGHFSHGHAMATTEKRSFYVTVSS